MLSPVLRIVITVTAVMDKKHLPLVKHVLFGMQFSELIEKLSLVRSLLLPERKELKNKGIKTSIKQEMNKSMYSLALQMYISTTTQVNQTASMCRR